MMTFAAYLAVGPDSTEPARMTDVVASLLHYEPSLANLIIIADGIEDVSVLDLNAVPSTCKCIVIPHPRPNSQLNKYGGLCTANLIALDYIRRHSMVDFVLKLDTDSLVIAPFSKRIAAFLEAHSNAGTAGALGDSCNRETRSFRMDAAVAKTLQTGVEIGLSDGSMSPEQDDVLKGWGVTTALQLQGLREISVLLEPLLRIEFAGTHCQGGSYVITRRQLDGLSATGLFGNPHLWLDFKIGEDQMMGAFCSIAGLQVLDFSNNGEVFGVQASGLAYSPAQLVDRGYGIIHSVKNDPNNNESEIRRFFRGMREPGPRL